MKAKARSILILGSIMLVGMLLGALLHAQFFDKRVRRVHRLSTPEGFVESYLNTIAPANSEEEARLREILSGYSVSVHEDFRKHREGFEKKLDAMRLELEPILNEEQLERLKERRSRRRRD